MLFANSLNGVESVVLGIAILFVVFLMRRSAIKKLRAGDRDLVADVRAEFLLAETKGTSKAEKLELRLYDYSREVEARIETRITLLDQLVVAADKEVSRLESLLQQNLAETQSASKPAALQQRRMIAHLAGSGFPPSEIAGLLGCPETDIRDILGDSKAA